MFGIGPATQIYLAVGATDMRKGFNGLHGLVRDRLELEPTSGHLFLFCNGSRNRLKVLFWDGSGLWICAKTNAPQCPQRLLTDSLSVSSLFWTCLHYIHIPCTAARKVREDALALVGVDPGADCCRRSRSH